MHILFFALFLLLTFAITFGLSKLIEMLAYPIESRYLHCRTVFAVIIVDFLAFNYFSLSYILKAINGIITLDFLEEFWRMILPQRAYKLTFMLLVVVFLNLTVLIVNLLTILVTKLIFMRSTSYKEIEDTSFFSLVIHFPWLVANKYFSQIKGERKLNSRGFTTGLWAKGIKDVFSFIFFAEIIVISLMTIIGTEKMTDFMVGVSKAAYYIPLVGALFFQQIQLFLEGEIDNAPGTFSSEDIDEEVTGDIGTLFSLYQVNFEQSGAMLYAERDLPHTVRSSGLHSNDISNSQVDDCDQQDILLILTNQIKYCGIRECINYQNALVALLNGKSVHIRDHAEGEFLIYMAAYLNYYISQGKTALVLCPTRAEAASFCRTLREKFKELNDIYSVWNIQTIDDVLTDMSINVLVCSFEDFMNQRIVTKRVDFMKENFCTVFINSSEIFSADGVRIERLFSDLRSAKIKSSFIFLSETDNDRLRTSAEKYLKVNLVPFNNDHIGEKSNLIVWRKESIYKLQRYTRIGNEISTYLGVALPLAAMAIKYDFPQVHIIDSGKNGDKTYKEVFIHHSHDVYEYIGDDSVNLENAIRFNVNEIMADRSLSMSVVYDDSFNLYNSLWDWAKYSGKNGSILHIISPTYMLRDYFVSNFRKLSRNTNFESLFFTNNGMESAVLIMLLINMCESGIYESDLKNKCSKYNMNYSNTEEVLLAALNLIRKKATHNLFECFNFSSQTYFDTSANDYVCDSLITITDENIRREILGNLQYVDVVIRDNVPFSLPVISGNLKNYYLKDQIFSFDGYFYQIYSMSDRQIFCEQYQPISAPEYYQLSDFEIRLNEIVDCCTDNGLIDFNICQADVDRHVYGYITTNCGNDFYRDIDNTEKGVITINGEPETISRDSVGVLELRIPRKCLTGSDIETERLLALMLNEIFKTLFPTNHQNLYAVMGDSQEEGFWKRVLFERAEFEDKIQSVIPFASKVVKSDEFLAGRPSDCYEEDDYISVYIVEFSYIELGLISEIYANREKVLKIIDDYLSWTVKFDALNKDGYEYRATVHNIGEEFEDELEEEPEEEPEEDPEEESEDETEKPKKKKKRYADETGEPFLIDGLTRSADRFLDVRNVFLSFGAESVPSVFDISSLAEVIKNCVSGFSEVESEEDVPPGLIDSERCTFCGKFSIFSVRLADGRRMCNNCKDHQLRQKDEIRSLFKETKQFMEKGYHTVDGENIAFPRTLYVRFQSADTIRRAMGGSIGTGRVLGFYSYKSHQLWVEARGPAIAVNDTLIHELTHAWQHTIAAFKKVEKKLTPKQYKMLIEGHAVYVEIETMKRLNEKEYARFIEYTSLTRTDEYGEGYKLVCELFATLKVKYSDDTYLDDPFSAMQRLLEELISGGISI